MKINIDNGKVLEEIITDEEENIYQKLARATARAVDINLGKTTLADLLDGYTKSITLQQRIDKAIEYIYLHSTQRKWFANVSDRLHNQEIQFKGRIEDLLEILGDKENE